MKTQNKIIFVALISLFMLNSCADHTSFVEASSISPVGFWHGLWHGVIAPLAWLVSLFYDDVAIYAIYNNGGWYDFGFIIGIGGLARSSSRR